MCTGCRGSRQQQHWAGQNSNSLMPAEMQARLNPCEVNGEVPKDVNGTRLNKKILAQEGERKL